LLAVLPIALGVEAPHDQWGDNEAQTLRDRLVQAVTLVTDLDKTLLRRLVSEIDTLFGGDGTAATLADVARCMREWCKSYVLLGTQSLSEPARVLFDRLQSHEDPAELLLRRLPNRIAEARAPYDRWANWGERAGYLRVLDEAAREIECAGQIGEGSRAACDLWDQLRTGMTALSDDDRRWLIKQFDDTFRL
jgi:hypothetical protein